MIVLQLREELTESLERAAMKPTEDDKSNELYIALAGVGFVALILVLTIVSALRLADDLGPHIGDIIKFNPVKKISTDLQELITVTPDGHRTGAPCVLDPRTMRASGGSLVIEAVQPKPDARYRVDWAGVHTSDGQADCGAEAEFLLSQSDIVALLLVAGN
jgi:hypothetical protein